MSLMTRKVIYPLVFCMFTMGMCVRNTDVYKNYQQKRFEADKEKGKEMLFADCDNFFERWAKAVEIEVKSKLHFQSTDEYIVETYRDKVGGGGLFDSSNIWGILTAIGATVVYTRVSEERRKEGDTPNNKINQNV